MTTRTTEPPSSTAAGRAAAAARGLEVAGAELCALAEQLHTLTARIAALEAIHAAALRQAGQPVPLGPPARALAADVLGGAIAPLAPFAVHVASEESAARARALLCGVPTT